MRRKLKVGIVGVHAATTFQKMGSKRRSQMGLTASSDSSATDGPLTPKGNPIVAREADGLVAEQ